MHGLEQPESVTGLLLAGGKSRRMGEDKANLTYPPRTVPQWRHTARVLESATDRVIVSIREGQVLEGWQAGDPPLLSDGPGHDGPLFAMCTAAAHIESALLVVACDLPLLDRDILDALLQARGRADCIAFRSATDGLPEPMCTLYEPTFFSHLEWRPGKRTLLPKESPPAAFRACALARPTAPGSLG